MRGAHRLLRRQHACGRRFPRPERTPPGWTLAFVMALLTCSHVTSLLCMDGMLVPGTPVLSAERLEGSLKDVFHSDLKGGESPDSRQKEEGSRPRKMGHWRPKRQRQKGQEREVGARDGFGPGSPCGAPSWRPGIRAAQGCAQPWLQSTVLSASSGTRCSWLGSFHLPRTVVGLLRSECPPGLSCRDTCHCTTAHPDNSGRSHLQIHSLITSARTFPHRAVFPYARDGGLPPTPGREEEDRRVERSEAARCWARGTEGFEQDL